MLNKFKVWVPEINQFKTDNFYIPDGQTVEETIETINNKIRGEIHE
jgi:hypothetical protein